MRTFTAALLSLALLLTLAACGSTPPEQSAETPAVTAEVTPEPTPESTPEPTPESTPQPTPAPEDTEAGKIAMEFAQVYFYGGMAEIEPWLVEDYQWGAYAYDSEAPTDILLQCVYPSEDEETVWNAVIRFRVGDEDSFTYLVLELVQGGEGWKVSFFGLDK